MLLKPDIKKDNFISRTEVEIFIDGMPSINFKDGKLYNQSLLHYNADLASESSKACPHKEQVSPAKHVLTRNPG